ncbi:MAG: hypothetical protein M3082_09230 [Candidatus Dormibacteraeota bacterium]|nr:hypothetical protein [Candidatus Dormibacteraeota bacterium]
MTTLGWVGVGLLVVAGLAVVVELILAAVWGVAVARRSMKLSERLQAERGMLNADMERLRLSIEEMKRLWRPYRTLLRWLRHPLTIALLQSYRRRGMVR